MILHEVISKLDLSQPYMRRRLFHLSVDNWDPENSLFLICAWDFIHGDQTGMKVAGFEHVFFKVGGAHELNLKHDERAAAIRTLHTPGSRSQGARDPRTGHRARPTAPNQSNPRALVAINMAFTSYMRSGESVRNWITQKEANELPHVNQKHSVEARKALAALQPYWSQADIERLVGR